MDSPVMKTDSSDPKLNDLQGHTRAILERYDEEVENSGLAGVWDCLIRVDDTSDMIRQTIFQFKQLFEQVHKDYYEDDMERKHQLKELRFNEEVDLVKLAKLINDQVKAKDMHIKQMNTVVTTMTKLQKEYRETMTARRNSVPVTEVLKMAMAFKSVIHQRIHDKRLLDDISSELSEIMRTLFPVGMGG